MQIYCLDYQLVGKCPWGRTVAYGVRVWNYQMLILQTPNLVPHLWSKARRTDVMTPYVLLSYFDITPPIAGITLCVTACPVPSLQRRQRFTTQLEAEERGLVVASKL